MTPEQIAAARALVEAATPGPWNEENGDVCVDGLGYPLAMVDGAHSPDARFIAWCRDGVPALLGALVAAEAELKVTDKLLSDEAKQSLDRLERAEAAEARAADLTAKMEAMREALSHTADQALAAEIPVGYGPEDKGAWTQGYDAAIRHARAALKAGGAA